MFFKKLFDEKIVEVKFTIIPRTNEEYICLTYGCFKVIDSYRFLSYTLEELIKNMDEVDFNILKKKFPGK